MNQISVTVNKDRGRIRTCLKAAEILYCAVIADLREYPSGFSIIILSDDPVTAQIKEPDIVFFQNFRYLFGRHEMLAQLLGPTQVIDHSDDLEVPVGVFFAQSLDALETGIVAVRVPEIKHCKLLPRKDRLVDGISVQIRRFERKIEFIELGDRDPSVLKGLRIIGNSVGSADDINGKASSLTDVRCIFEFYEWIEFYPDMDPECELSVYVIEHREDQEFYNDCKFSEDMPGFVSICDLRYPTDADNPAEWYWGNLYLSPDENAAGFYDFVFVYEGKAIATLLTRFYNETELSDRSGVELEELMHGK